MLTLTRTTLLVAMPFAAALGVIVHAGPADAPLSIGVTVARVCSVDAGAGATPIVTCAASQRSSVRIEQAPAAPRFASAPDRSATSTPSAPAGTAVTINF